MIYMVGQCLKSFRKIILTSQFHEDFVKNYNEENDEVYVLEVDIQYPE